MHINEDLVNEVADLISDLPDVIVERDQQGWDYGAARQPRGWPNELGRPAPRPAERGALVNPVECEICGGVGQVRDNSLRSHGMDSDYDHIECPECNGTKVMEGPLHEAFGSAAPNRGMGAGGGSKVEDLPDVPLGPSTIGNVQFEYNPTRPNDFRILAIDAWDETSGTEYEPLSQDEYDGWREIATDAITQHIAATQPSTRDQYDDREDAMYDRADMARKSGPTTMGGMYT